MATPTCKICSHAQRAQIERALADPAQSNRAIAKQYSLCARTLDRHKNNCTRVAVAKTLERQERAIGVDVVDRMQALQHVTAHIMDTALRGLPVLDKLGKPILDKNGKQVVVSDPALALKAISQARHNYRLIAQLTGKLNPQDDGQTHLVTFEEFSVMWRRVVEKAA